MPSPYIKLDHTDMQCIINLMNDVDLTPEERITLSKCEAILAMQKLAAGQIKAGTRQPRPRRHTNSEVA